MATTDDSLICKGKEGKKGCSKVGKFQAAMAARVLIPILLVVIWAGNGAEAVIGMNWGRQSAQKLVPSQVVDLLLQNQVSHVRLYSTEPDVMKAFAGSGINITAGIFSYNAFRRMEDARTWVRWKGPSLVAANTRGIVIGTNVFFKGIKDKVLLRQAIDCVKYTQEALNEAGYGDIKVGFQHFNGILKRNHSKPSEAEFLDEIKEEMIEVVRYQQANNIPFRIEMFPIFDTSWNYMDPSFAFPDNKSTQVITDVNGALYTNIFDFVHDSFVWALTKINASDLKIVVAQVGWPTDGYPGANATAAERFFKALLPRVVSDRGTPMRPGAPVDIFIQSVTDENKMVYDKLPFTRHWGIYRSNGQPKYKIDLTGQGRDIYPTTIRGIMRMPERWCVFNGNLADLEKVKVQFDAACGGADCTSLLPGGSCSQLSREQNVSYAFNVFFQFHYQDESACDFAGLGRVTVVDPSTDRCTFPVEVVKGQQEILVAVVKVSAGNHHIPNSAIVVFLLLIFTTFIWE